MLRTLHELRAQRHHEKAKDGDLSGVNHVVMRLNHPNLGCLAVACACGKVFWVHRKFKGEIVKREDFKSEDEFRRALRVQFGVVVHDVSKRKSRKIRERSGHGVVERPKRKKESPTRWF